MTDGEQRSGHENADGLPAAVIRPQRRISIAWIVPILALGLAVWLGFQSWRQRGLIVEVQLEQGHGLKAGDAIRFRGIAVGEILDVQLDDGLGGVVVRGSLRSQPKRLARVGSRFWVVRPRLALDEVAGLETLVGPRYLAVLPGSGAPQRRFVGLPDPPVVESIEPGDLQVILHAPAQNGLRAGAPMVYRGMRVGTVLSVGLTSDGGAVEARVHVEKAYAPLVRPETRFWSASGVEADMSLRGISVRLDSLQSLVAGGVAMATPPGARPMVHTGHRFRLADEPDPAWLSWEPMVAIGSALLPPGVPRPAPRRATTGWRQGLFRSRASRQGWVLPTERGLLGPLDLLRADPDARPETAQLEVAGVEVGLDEAPTRTDGRLATLDVEIGDAASRWPSARIRAPERPEDCLVFGDPTAAPVPLAESRFTAGEGEHPSWRVDPAVAVDASWHGACVLSRADGALIGLLLVDDDGVLVAPVSAE